MNWKQGSARAGVFVGVFIASALGGRGVTAMLVTDERPRAAPAVAPAERFNFDSAMTRFTGRLSNGAVGTLRDGGLPDTAVVVVLRKQDLATCEDLGRQLREMGRIWGTSRTLRVWGEAADTAAIREFVRRERIARVRVQPVRAGGVMRDGSDVRTPAVLVVTGAGEVIEGVSHPLRVPNLRLRSFAQELRTIGRRAGEGSDATDPTR